MHKGKKITLVPMTPAEIVKYEQDRIHNDKEKSVLQPEKQQHIKLKKTLFSSYKN